ncbi:interferon gamma 1 [Amia ocellicauda]|uniref:interferon gamma 1 n=1 Tax=Amia ocellicauda TaxID=2972642 RepID=UPI003464DB82
MDSLQRSLLLFIGICLITFGRVYTIDLMSDEMKEDIKWLGDYFQSNNPRLVEGGAIFTNVLKTFEKQESEEKLLLNEILNLYIDIFNNMDNPPENPKLRQSIDHIKIRLGDLKKNAFLDNASLNLKNKLQELWEIKVNDPVVQRKAVFELKPVLLKALDIQKKVHEKMEKKRKRRHARLSQRRTSLMH